MAHTTAVIDIGSNSMRMAVFTKTSRFAFHIIHEVKSSVRLSENAYNNGGYLQETPMERTAKAIGEFLMVASSFKARKILCVATSALRDAPNASDFISRIRRDHGLSIKVIDGMREAYLGGIACANLLSKTDLSISVDVGGGSSEFAVIKNGKVNQLYSLNIGTVRLKELFMDKKNIDGAIAYIDTALEQLPFEGAQTVIGIGGTFRALTRALMKESYPLKKLHGYTTDIETFETFADAIMEASVKKLKSLYIKADRFDTIKPGTLILQRIIRRLNTQQIICSGVGVREGVYLSDLLRNSHDCYPNNYNPSLRYLLDTYATHSHHGIECASLAKRLFDILHLHLELDPSWKRTLTMAAKLLPIGLGVRYYAYQRHSHYLAINGLNYGLSHSEIALISHLLLFKKGNTSSDLIPKNSYGPLLPSDKIINGLYTILWLSHIVLAQRSSGQELVLDFNNGHLLITGENLYLAKEQLKNLPLPHNLAVSFS